MYEKRKALNDGISVLGYLKRIAVNYALQMQKQDPNLLKENKFDSTNIKS
jgi:hypothetical protein